MNDSTPMKATPGSDLERFVMDSRISKSESEWWARTEILRLRAILRDFMEITEGPAQAPIKNPKYASEIRALGREIGYGALMAGAAAEWREVMRGKPDHPQGTEFCVGPCMAVLLDTRERARRALGQ